ncbi:MAG: hypothetical protein M0Z31_14495 [Clostridia bacterium]|nr:hypothetical protein [Clostridia bacterium]
MNRSKGLITIMSFLLFMFAFGGSWYFFSNIFPLKKIFAGTDTVEGIVYRPLINSKTKIYQEITYLCGNKVKSQVTNESLIGLDYNSLRQRYKAEKGWVIDDSVPNTLFLIKTEGDFCSLHRNFRHLGVSDGFLGVFQGPLGAADVLIQKEDVELKFLPVDMQIRLQRAEDFKNLPQEEQKVLKDNLEFKNDETLNAFLDGLDEFDQ